MDHVRLRHPRTITFDLLRLPFAVTLILIACAGLGHAGSWKGQEVQKNGVMHMVNPATGMENPVTVDLKELWRLGGESDSEEEFFGVITRIETDAKGNVYVLDTQLSEVKVYDANGQFVRKLGREGEGPGEFRRPADMFFMPDGNLGVIQFTPGNKIVMLKPTGEPAGDFPLQTPEGGGFQILRGGRLCGNQLVLARQLQSFTEGKVTQKMSLDRLDLKGQIIGSLVSFDRTLELANLVIDEKEFTTWEQGGRWDAGSDGRVHVATGGPNYEITVFKPDGSKDRVVEKAYERYKRTTAETDEIRGIFETFTRQAPNAKVAVNDYDPDINALYPRDDGSLWVLSSQGARKPPAGALGVFDVFDDKGRFVRQVTLKGQGNPREDGYFFVGDRLYVVTGWLDALMAMQGGAEKQEADAEAAPMELICYRVEAPAVAKGK